MKTRGISRSVLAFGILLLALAPAGAQDDLAATLARLAGGDSDLTVLDVLEGHRPDPRILPALESEFEQSKATDAKQRVAATLVRLGDHSPAYYEYLEAHARVAIDDQSPLFLKYDEAGNFVRGEFDPGFLNWCAVNGKNPRDVAKIQFGDYPNSMRMFAYAQDPRARDLLRRGLGSANPLVVRYAVEGLGRLRDSESLKLIAASLERLRPDGRQAVSEGLCYFPDVEAERLYERSVPYREAGDMSCRLIRRLLADEDKRAQQRTAQAPPK
jgi:hypothetical protein